MLTAMVASPPAPVPRLLSSIPWSEIHSYIMADVSGAHLNPAVSIGLLVGKRISIERFLIYVPTQVIVLCVKACST